MVRVFIGFVLLGLMCLCSIVSYASTFDDVADVLKELKSKNAGVRASAAREIGRLGAISRFGRQRRNSRAVENHQKGPGDQHAQSRD